MSRRGSCRILVVGPAFIKSADLRVAEALNAKGFDSISLTPRGAVGEGVCGLRNVTASGSRIVRALQFLWLLHTVKPHHVELYVAHPLCLVPYYALLSRLMGRPVLIWSRGELFSWSERSLYRRLMTRLAYCCASRILAKEAYVPDRLRQMRVAAEDKLVWMPNKVPVAETFALARSAKNVLFLNSPKAFRHIEILAEAIPAVVSEVPEARFWFVGARTAREREHILGQMRRTGAQDWVEVKYYDAETRSYYEDASVFVLPAELVFANNSLLEAMERGVPPIVAEVDPDVGRIVEHGVNGLVLPLDPRVWADGIVDLLTDEVYRQRLGAKARDTVVSNFNLNNKIPLLLRIYDEI